MYKQCIQLSLAALLWLPYALPVMAAPSPEETRLRQSLVLRPNDAKVNYQLGSYLMEALRQDWRQRVLEPQNPQFAKETANFSQRIQEIERLLAQAIKLNDRYIEPYVDLAELKFIYLNQNKVAEALLQNHPDPSQLPNQNQAAEQLLKKALELDPKHPKAVIAWSEYLYFHQDQREAALQRLQDAHQAVPQNADIAITLADLISYETIKPEDFAKAQTVLQTALQGSENKLAIQLMMGRILMRSAQRNEELLDKADLAKAIAVFETILATQPQNQDALMELALAAQMQQDLAKAQSTLETLIKQAPKSGKALLLLGDILLEKNKNDMNQGGMTPALQAAEGYYKRLLAPGANHQLSASEQTQLFYNLGLLAALEANTPGTEPTRALRRFEEAIQMYQQAIAIFDAIKVVNRSLQQDLARAYLGKGQILKTQNKELEARQLFEQACQLQLDLACQALKLK